MGGIGPRRAVERVADRHLLAAGLRHAGHAVVGERRLGRRGVGRDGEGGGRERGGSEQCGAHPSRVRQGPVTFLRGRRFRQDHAVPRDELTGADVVIVGSRQSRPDLPTSDGCPFCVGGTEAPEPYDVRWFVNRWPAMPKDRCEVVLYTSQHDATMWSLGAGGVRKVVDLWAERTVALGARKDVEYVLVFENRGREVGATIPHPHGQIYGFDHVPPAVTVELESDTCALCDEHGRHVLSTESWRAYVPKAASWPYELRIVPREHVPDLPSLDDAQRDDLAAILVDVLRRLDALFGMPMPYMLWIHQRPTDGGDWPTAHLHVHIAPLLRAEGTPRFVAAGELGSGVFFNPVRPEDAAEALRSAGF
jgi:UDPglucose--hexose-1-phosphate uridylyltransferase